MEEQPEAETVWSIKTYARIKPILSQSTMPNIFEQEDLNVLRVSIPEGSSDDWVNNFKDSYSFRYNYVFNQNADQSEIYKHAADGVVQSVLDGYNGTIFAYGQTGSGKTYTMTGGERYEERGLIPRSISHIFSSIETETKKSKGKIKTRCYVSYLEIYNESVFDLLDQNNRNKKLEEWDKIQLLDNDNGDLHLKNLSVYEACTEEDALNLLFLGNINRVTSETPMNLASSRSHCIFTMTIETRNKEADTLCISKLNLVDLAGSERIFKREGDERTTIEGKYINLSLHYLEQVIVRLQENARQKQKLIATSSHIPYRNSTLTTVLRDSIGGNCKTIFVATLNGEDDYVFESLSTCRFAQRCSQLANVVRSNEEVDVNVVVQRLTRENQLLKKKLKEMERARTFALRANALVNNTNTSGTQKKGRRASSPLSISTRLSPKQQRTPKRRGSDPNVSHKFETLISKPGSITNKDIEDIGGTKEMIHYMRDLIISLRNPKKSPKPLKNKKDTKSQSVQVVSQSNEAKETGVTVETKHVDEEDSDSDLDLSKLLTDTEINNEFEDMLSRGAIFVKHGRYGKPHARFVWVSRDRRFILWRKVGVDEVHGSLAVKDIACVLRGRSTPVFRRQTVRPGVREGALFSLLTNSGRSLDLEVDLASETTTRESIANESRVCDEWAEAFNYLISRYRGMQRAPIVPPTNGSNTFMRRLSNRANDIRQSAISFIPGTS